MTIRREDVDAGLMDFSDVASGQLLPPVHPGDVLRDEFLAPMELDVNRLAQEIEVPCLDDIMHGRCAVTAETALLLGRRFNMTPNFWMNLQARYDRDLDDAFAVANAFVEGLAETPGDSLFNPWFERDHRNDASEDSPAIRRRQLVHYLAIRRGHARYLLIAEAAGYQGAHFSGIAMTSERILLGHRRGRRILPHDVLHGLEPVRTSSDEIPGLPSTVRRQGFTEPTATTVWSTLRGLEVRPLDFVLWNAVPWHPYCPDEGLLSNRTPTQPEQDASKRHLEGFLALYPGARRIAVGNVSQDLFSDYDDVYPVRHPSNGGVREFRAGMAELMREATAENA